MSEDCTPEYIDRVRAKFAGRWICGLCSEAVKEEEEKNGGKREEAVNSHINACSKFNKFARAYPVLYQAEAMREMLKKTRADPRGLRAAKTFSARDNKGKPNKAGIARSSSTTASSVVSSTPVALADPLSEGKLESDGHNRSCGTVISAEAIWSIIFCCPGLESRSEVEGATGAGSFLCDIANVIRNTKKSNNASGVTEWIENQNEAG
nr:uncharacterized protein LOC109192547 [Ipomoea batatas]